METNCGYSFDGVISCDEETKEVRVLDCYCITLSNKTVAGECFMRKFYRIRVRHCIHKIGPLRRLGQLTHCARTGDKTGLVVGAMKYIGGRYVCTCTMHGLHTYFLPHEPYIVANVLEGSMYECPHNAPSFSLVYYHLRMYIDLLPFM